MIKPVKRNKRLKWIDSHYAKPFLKPKLTLTINAKPFKKGIRKVRKSLDRLSKKLSRKVKG